MKYVDRQQWPWAQRHKNNSNMIAREMEVVIN